MKQKFTHALSALCVCAAFAAISFSCKKTQEEEPPVPPVDTEYSLSVVGDKAVILPDTLKYGIGADSTNIMVIAKRAGWGSAVTADGQWLSIDPVAGDTGTTNAMIRITANTVEDVRVGKITFTQSESGKEQTVIVYQAPVPPLITSRETDSLALVTVYDAFDGKNLFTKKWDLKTPITGWNGITCSLVNGEMRVTGFNCTEPDAKGTIPAELGNLRELRHFVMHVIRVKGNLPDGLGFAGNLDSLDIYGSTGIVSLPSSMKRLKKLRAVRMSGSGVSVMPSDFNECIAMERFLANPTASKAVLKGNANAFSNMPNLKLISVGKCEMTGDLSFLKNKKHLRQVEFTEGNLLSGDLNLMENLVGCDSLEALNLGSAPQLTGTLKGLSICPSLRMFSVIESKVSGTLADAETHKHPLLGSLWVPKNEITGNVPANFKQMVTVDVSMNKLSGTLPQNIVDSIRFFFGYSDRLCPQKEGFGFTNCIGDK